MINDHAQLKPCTCNVSLFSNVHIMSPCLYTLSMIYHVVDYLCIDCHHAYIFHVAFRLNNFMKLYQYFHILWSSIMYNAHIILQHVTCRVSYNYVCHDIITCHILYYDYYIYYLSSNWLITHVISSALHKLKLCQCRASQHHVSIQSHARIYAINLTLFIKLTSKSISFVGHDLKFQNLLSYRYYCYYVFYLLKIPFNNIDPRLYLIMMPASYQLVVILTK